MTTTTTRPIRKGDTVRLPDGSTARVTGRRGGYVFTDQGTYDPKQLKKEQRA